MSTELTNPNLMPSGSGPSAATSKRASSKAELYWQQQIEKTQQLVRWSQITRAAVNIFAFFVGFLLLCILVEAWVMPFTTTLRWIASFALLAGIGGIVSRQLWPVLRHRVHQAYAAKMIEEGSPGFHNSLLNYWFLKQSPNHASPQAQAIEQAVAHRAARDLSSITVSEKVDHSGSIRSGIVLTTLVAVLVAYAILSPKSPWPTIQRILWPLAEVQAPAAARIASVDPGNATVFSGQRLLVSVEVVGRHAADDVQLVFSTNDGQQVDIVRAMQAEGGTGRYQLELATSTQGIQTDFRYHIQAGDGRSPDYQVTVRPNPTIAVKTLTIEPPRYTKLPPRTLPNSGEIEAVEGSWVQINATANLPIEVATLELLRARNPGRPDTVYDLVRTVDMPVSNSPDSQRLEASGRVLLTLDASRKSQPFTHYQLKFRSRDGVRNDIVNLYPIKIVADQPPEIAIQQPESEKVSLPINRTLPIVISARDPDYELARLQLVIERQGSRIWDEVFELANQQTPQTLTREFVLNPNQLKLTVGQEIVCYARAEDNRHSPINETPDPNVARTPNLTIQITAVDPTASAENQPQNSKTEQPNTNNGSAADNAPPQNNQQQGENQQGENQQGENQQGENQQGENQQGENQQGANSQSSNSKPPQQSNTGSGEQGANNSSNQQQNNQNQQPSNAGNSKSQSQNNNGQNQNQSNSQSNNQSSQQSGNAESNSQNQTAKAQDKEQQGQPGNASSSDKNQQTGQSGNSGQSAGSDSQQTPQSNQAGENAGQQTPTGTGNNQSSSTPTQNANAAPNQTHNPNPNAGTGSNQNSQPGGSDADDPGQRDQQLTSGQREPLDKNADDGQRFERLLEEMQRQQENQAKQTDPSNAQENQSNRSNDTAEQSTGTDPNNQNREQPPKTEDQTGKPQNQQGQGGDQQGQGGDKQGQGGDKQGQGGDKQGQGGDKQGQGGDKQGQGGDQQGQGGDKQGQGGDKQGQGGDQQGQGGDKQGQGGDQQGQGGDQQGQGGDQQGQGGDQQGQGGDKQGQGGDKQGQGGDKQGQGGDQQGQGGDKQGQGGDKQGQGGEQPTQGGGQSSGNGQSAPGGTGGGAGAGGMSGGAGSSSGNGSGNSNTPSGQPAANGNSSENLEESKKATDLVLDYLRNQEKNPNPELLEQMNWTDNDLRDFLQRWQAMKERAKVGSTEDRKRYEEALESLGLRSRGPRAANSSGQTRRNSGLGENNAVQNIPDEYAEMFHQFKKNLGRSKTDR